jgi:alkanesulfonate monooxygenase SsuD/methylene tetrahydromethanopterin reductase-like flavin-dependent oxidoreductase (luciferase family)
LFDEMLAVMRHCWTGEAFTHHGDRYDYDDVRVLPPATRMEVWLGGIAPSELRRIGRMADGWLPSFVTPADAATGRSVIEEVCAEHGRSIEHDHYGALVPYSFGPIPDRLMALLAKRRPDLADPSELVPTSWEGLTDLIGRFIDVGTSKFVVLPLVEPGAPDAWVEHLTEAAEVLLPLETH